MAVPRIEAETVVLWNDAEPLALIHTRSLTTVRRLSKKGYRFKELRPGSSLWQAEVPKRLCQPRAARASTKQKPPD